VVQVWTLFRANTFFQIPKLSPPDTQRSRTFCVASSQIGQHQDILHLRFKNDGATEGRPGRVRLSLGTTKSCAPMIVTNILGLEPIPGRLRAIYQPLTRRGFGKQQSWPWVSPAPRRMASTLPRMPIFEAIASHSLRSTAIVHSPSGRTFSYGELAHDVAASAEDLKRKAGGRSLAGERIAFLVENGYDYVGAHRRACR
jgi:hypothetical protein